MPSGWHGFLKARGIDCLVVDAASMQVNRRARRAKTDRIDVGMLLRALIAWSQGDRHVWSLVRVPSVEEEDLRRSHRERDRLVRERTAHIVRIKGPLFGQGIRRINVKGKYKTLQIDKLVTGDGRPLPPRLASEITREIARLALIQGQIVALDHVPIWNADDLERKLEEFIMNSPPTGESWKSSNIITTKIAITSRSVAALREQRSGQPPPAHAVLDHYAWRHHCRALFQSQSKHNYEFATHNFQAVVDARHTCEGAPETGALPKIQPVRASGSDLGRLDLQKLAGTRDRDRPRLHGLWNLAHEVDV